MMSQTSMPILQLFLESSSIKKDPMTENVQHAPPVLQVPDSLHLESTPAIELARKHHSYFQTKEVETFYHYQLQRWITLKPDGLMRVRDVYHFNSGWNVEHIFEGNV